MEGQRDYLGVLQVTHCITCRKPLAGTIIGGGHLHAWSNGCGSDFIPVSVRRCEACYVDDSIERAKTPFDGCGGCFGPWERWMGVELRLYTPESNT